MFEIAVSVEFVSLLIKYDASMSRKLYRRGLQDNNLKLVKLLLDCGYYVVDAGFWSPLVFSKTPKM